MNYIHVISGKYKGRKIEGFNIDGTRPTMDRVKESLFSSIQNYIKDSIVLDLFAGTGSLGIEALSMGASKCYFVDNNKIAINTMNKTINTIGINEAILINDDYKNALEKFKNSNIKFDLILLDPPYKLNMLNDAMSLIEKNNLLNDNGIIVCEYDIENPISSLEIIKNKKYGNKKIIVFQK